MNRLALIIRHALLSGRTEAKSAVWRWLLMVLLMLVPVAGFGQVTVGTTFGGVTYSPDGWGPLDPNGAAGPNHICQIVNTALAIYTKSGQLIQFKNLDSFSGGKGIDPTVVYDTTVNRWVICSGLKTVYFAVSDTSDPTEGWSEFHALSFPGAGDGGRFGFNASAYFLAYPDNPGTIIIDKASMLDKDNSTFTWYRWSPPGNKTLMMDDTANPITNPGDPMWYYDSTHLYKITNYLTGTPGGNATPTVQTINVTGGTVQTSKYAEIRNGKLAGIADFGALNWSITDIATATVTQHGTIPTPAGYSNIHLNYIGQHPNGDIGVVFEADSTDSNRMSMFVTGRAPGDPVNTMRTPVIVKTGTHTGARMGDYCSVMEDPSNGTFWAFSQPDNNGPYWTMISNFGISGVPPTPLQQVAGFGILPSDGTNVQVQWLEVPGATNYQLLRSTDAVKFTTVANLPSGTTSYTDTPAAPVSSYYYEIVASNGQTTSGASGLIKVVLAPTPPTYNALPAPGNLVASLGTGNAVQLDWSDIVGETGYAIERAGPGSTWTQIGTTATDVVQYIDANPTGSALYYYRVSALGSGGTKSAPSTVVNITNRPSSPGLTVTYVLDTQLQLQWSGGNRSATGYTVSRSTDGVNYSVIGTSPTQYFTYTDSGLTPMTTYYYKVVANGVVGDSLPGTGSAMPRLLPTTVTVAQGTNQLAVSWTSVANANSYQLQRSTDNTNFTTIATQAGTSFADTTVSPLVEYFYRVIASNTANGDTSPPSASDFGVLPGALPVGWASQDVGLSGTGAAGFSSNTYTVFGCGADIWGTSDQFHFVYQQCEGDAVIVAKVTSQQATSNPKTGVMIRESLASGSTYAFTCLTPGLGAIFETRTITGGSSTYAQGPANQAPYWVKVIRQGNAFTSQASADGVNWTTVGTVTVPMKSIAYIGLASDSGSSGVLNLSTFSNVYVDSVVNVALGATATASSTYNGSYPASNAVDGNSSTEWASLGQQNPWIQVNWPAAQTIAGVTFMDRVNSSDWAAGGTLTFSDNSTVTVSGIPNDGTPYTVSFSPRSVTWMKFQVVGGSGPNVGLSELMALTPLQVMGVVTPASAAVNGNGTAALSVLGQDPFYGESGLTYTWAATSMPNGATAPSFTANGTNAAKNTTAMFEQTGTYTLTVTLSDAGGATATSSVTVNITTLGSALTWNGGGGNGNLSNAANWVGGVAPQPGDILILTGATQTSVVNDYPAGTVFRSLSIQGNNFTLSGNPIALDSNSIPTIASSGTSDSMSLPIVLAGNTSVSVSSGSLSLSGVVSGAGSLTKSGLGTLLLSAANTYSGGTNINAGRVVLGSGTGLGTGAAILASGAVLDVGGFACTTPLSISGTGDGTIPALYSSSTTAGGSISSLTLNADASFGNAIANDFGKMFGVGALNLNGGKLTLASGTVNLGLSNIPNGNIDVNSGSRLVLTSGGSLNNVSGTITVKTGGILDTRDSDNSAVTSAHTIALNGGLLGNALTSGNNGGGIGAKLKNNITVDATNGGTIQSGGAFGNPVRLYGSLSGSGALTVNGNGIEFIGDGSGYTGTVSGGTGTFTFNNTGNKIFNGVLAGGRSVSKTGAGTTTLLGNNSFTGTTTISGGVFEAPVLANGGSNSALGAATNAANKLVFGAPTGTLRYIGSANVTTNRSFTLSSGVSGGATIESSGTGTLAFDNTIALAYGTTAQTRLVTLGGTNTGANLFGKVLADNGTGLTSLTKAGIGSWTLATTNTYTGATTVNGGTLNVTGSIASSAVTVNSGGTIAGTGTTGAVTVASGGTLAPGLGGIGTLSLSGKALSLAGECAMEINQSTGTSDVVQGVTSLTYGGTLTVSNVAGTLAAGNTFTLFPATSYSGSFATINLPTLVTGLTWNTSQLGVNGTVSVDPVTYTLTYNAGSNGTVSGSTPQTVNYGSNGTAVSAVPDTGYHFVSWSDGGTANPRTDANVTANLTVTANFAINTYTLTYNAGVNGTLSGTTPQTVNYGTSGTAVSAVPNSGYAFSDWSDGSTANPRTDTNVTANLTVTANFVITGPQPLPAPWTTAKIGSFSAAVDATQSNGTFNITGGGANISGKNDEFYFASQPWSGNCTLTARVASLQNTGPAAKAGVMIRESSATGSRSVFIGLTPGSGAQWVRRSTTGGNSSTTTSSGKTAPYWVRLTRNGNTFTSYISPNGTTWTQLASVSISMANNCLVGFATCSGASATANASVFDNFNVTSTVTLPGASLAPATLPTMGPLTLENGTVSFTITGEANGTWELQESTDFVNWTPLQTITLPDGAIQHSEADDRGSRRFFRLRADP